MKLGARFLTCVFVALLPALWIGSIALDHNPQGEFADPLTGAFTDNLYIVVGLWWAFFAILLMVPVTLFYYLVRKDKK